MQRLQVLLALAAMFALSACGEDDDSSDGFTSCTPGAMCSCPDGSTLQTMCDQNGAAFCPCAASPMAGGGGAGGVGGATGGAGGAAGMFAGTGGVGGMTGGIGGIGGVGGTGGMTGGVGGTGGGGGMTGGMGGMTGGMGGMMMSGAGGDGGDPGAGETGPMVGMTAAHNAKRAMVDTDPPLGELVWDDEIAQFAQGYADQLAESCSNNLVHNDSDYGENLAAFFSSFPGGGLIGSAQQSVNNWYNEVECWSFGTIGGTEDCDQSCVSQMNSNGCGHYTQVVWRGSQRLGCGVASCSSGGSTIEYWVCNYDPPGNWIGMAPY